VKLTKDQRAQTEDLEAAFKKIKTLQHHKEKSKEFSDQVETYKEELTRLKKVEAELTKLNSKLKAEVESLAGTPHFIIIYYLLFIFNIFYYLFCRK
jgi:cell shape-determining protein MreC